MIISLILVIVSTDSVNFSYLQIQYDVLNWKWGKPPWNWAVVSQNLTQYLTMKIVSTDEVSLWCIFNLSTGLRSNGPWGFLGSFVYIIIPKWLLTEHLSMHRDHFYPEPIQKHFDLLNIKRNDYTLLSPECDSLLHIFKGIFLTYHMLYTRYF
jgi:hypothetical protein